MHFAYYNLLTPRIARGTRVGPALIWRSGAVLVTMRMGRGSSSWGLSPLDERFKDLDAAVPLQGMLGYLNFAGGKPDARFQKHLSDAYRWLAKKGAPEPHTLLPELLRSRLAELRAGGTSAFRDTRQAEAILALVFEELLPAYRAHHGDLLFHH